MAPWPPAIPATVVLWSPSIHAAVISFPFNILPQIVKSGIIDTCQKPNSQICHSDIPRCPTNHYQLSVPIIISGQPSRNRSFINNDHHYQGCRNRAGMGVYIPPIVQNFANFRSKNTVEGLKTPKINENCELYPQCCTRIGTADHYYSKTHFIKRKAFIKYVCMAQTPQKRSKFTKQEFAPS